VLAKGNLISIRQIYFANNESHSCDMTCCTGSAEYTASRVVSRVSPLFGAVAAGCELCEPVEDNSLAKQMIAGCTARGVK
jgi:hypothetical protein